MFASIRKIFSADSQEEGTPPSRALKEELEGTPKALEIGSKQSGGYIGPTTTPLDIPWKPVVSNREVEDDDDDDVPSCLVSMSCPLPGNRPQPKFVPRRPAVKPATAPKAASKLPNLELPPSLPNDHAIPPPPPQPMSIDSKSFDDFSYHHAASCPPAFRLIVDPEGTTSAYIQVDASTPLANSPLIYEVLLSGCLRNSVHIKRINRAEPPMRQQDDSVDHIMTTKDEDELAEMEL